MTRQDTRELCKWCGCINPIGFSVPDKTYDAVVPPGFTNKVVCLGCFIRLADEKLVAWDLDIQFFPVSRKTMLSKVKP